MSCDDADSVHSMTRTPPSMSGSPKPSFNGDGEDYDEPLLNSDGEEIQEDQQKKAKKKSKTVIPPRIDIKKTPRERYWGVTNGKLF